MNQRLLRQPIRGGSRGGKSRVSRAGEVVACPVVTSPWNLEVRKQEGRNVGRVERATISKQRRLENCGDV